jgi:hypothetical protein
MAHIYDLVKGKNICEGGDEMDTKLDNQQENIPPEDRKVRQTFIPVHGVSKNFPVRLLGTRFEVRNCIGEPCLQAFARKIFVFEMPWRRVLSNLRL